MALESYLRLGVFVGDGMVTTGNYDEAAKTLTFGKRNGSFNGMLKERNFRIVYVTADQPRPLDFEPQNVPVVSYKGNQMVVNL